MFNLTSYDLCKPLLELLKDGKPHRLQEFKVILAKSLGLKKTGRTTYVKPGSVFSNRCSTALGFLKKARLIAHTGVGIYTITHSGLDVLRENPCIIDREYLKRFTPLQEPDKSKLLQYQIPNEMKEKIIENLTDEILLKMASMSSPALVHLITDLLAKMGYRVFSGVRQADEILGNESIHGIIFHDALGELPVYVHFHKTEPGNIVEKIDLQRFSKIVSQKGGGEMFVTLASFSQEAQEYAKRREIILMDGARLAHLMISHDFCVVNKQVQIEVDIKAIDTDAFNDYEDL